MSTELSSCTVSKPVAQTSVSIGRSWPSVVTMPWAVKRSIGVVTSSTFGREKAG